MCFLIIVFLVLFLVFVFFFPSIDVIIFSFIVIFSIWPHTAYIFLICCAIIHIFLSFYISHIKMYIYIYIYIYYNYALEFVSDLARRSRLITNDPLSYLIICQQISVCIQNFNTISILGCHSTM